MKYRNLLSLLIFLFLCGFSVALANPADEHPTLAIGASAPAFNLPGVDGKTYNLASFANSKILVIVFTCNHCPFAKLYQERMNELHKTFIKKGFPVIAISSPTRLPTAWRATGK